MDRIAARCAFFIEPVKMPDARLFGGQDCGSIFHDFGRVFSNFRDYPEMVNSSTLPLLMALERRGHKPMRSGRNLLSLRQTLWSSAKLVPPAEQAVAAGKQAASP